jgi:glycosyltransferase involved in cell wall biosynthesis
MLKLPEKTAELAHFKVKIVVPALNEQANIRGIVTNIAEQDIPCEIVIADNGSTDRTIEIVRECQVESLESYPHIKITLVNVPEKGVANARNAGARAAQEGQDSDYIIFLDADTRVEKGFIQKTIEEMAARNLDVGACTLNTTTDKAIDSILLATYNKIIILMQNISPSGVGAGMVAKPEIFEMINGFDPNMRVYEDADFAKRAARAGAKFGVLNDSKIIFSLRRVEKEGRLAMAYNYIVSGIYYYLTGKVRPGMKYNFGEFKE